MKRLAELDSGKAAIRRQILAARREISPAVLAESSNRVWRQISNLDEYKRAWKVHCYISLPGEVQTEQMIRDCWESGKEVYLPVQIPGEGKLLMGRYSPGDQLIPGPYGVWEPAESKITSLPPAELDLILVPGVAFDSRGNRLGYGKGYYDAFLSDAGITKNPDQVRPDGVTAIGLALDFQIIDYIPVSDFDVPVGVIVTERKTIRRETPGGSLSMQATRPIF